MTEYQWLNSTDPARMVEYLLGVNYIPYSILSARDPTRPPEVHQETRVRKPGVTDQKLHLLTLALNHIFEGRGWSVGEALLGLKDVEQNRAACSVVRDIFHNPFQELPYYQRNGKLYPHHVVVSGTWPTVLEDWRKKSLSIEPVDWLTPTVRALAAAAYEERGGACGWCGGKGKNVELIRGSHFRGAKHGLVDCPDCHGSGRIGDGTLDPGRLAVLADALEDAGCEDEELLKHLRIGGHICGCWVLDLLLGKE